MILSVSRRTDIPAHYAEWFFRRLKEGYVCTRNPMNPKQVSRIKLSPDMVDGIVFWTKNPAPMLDRLPELEGYPYYFQVTMTSYGPDLEPGVPGKNDVVIPAFQALSREIGPERVIWRYDPVLLSPKYTTEYHARWFEAMARKLAGYTDRCVLSFLDDYRHLGKVSQELGFRAPDRREMRELAEKFAETAQRYGLTLQTCAEAIDLIEFGITHGRCIDSALFERITGQPFDRRKDPNQRSECGCMIAVDIGLYDTCPNGCKYCYANHTPTTLQRNIHSYDPDSPLLCSKIGPEDTVRERRMESCRLLQMSFYDEENPVTGSENTFCLGTY